MNPSAVLRSVRLGPLTRLLAAWGVWAALGLVSTVPAFGQSASITPAGTVVTNEATVTYSTQNGSRIETASTVSFTVGQVAGIDIDLPRTVISDAGRDVVFPHTVANIGNGPDGLEVAALSPSGWAVSVLHDVDDDRLLTSPDTVITDALPADMGDAVPVLVVVSVPSTTPPGSVEVVTLTATSRFDGTKVDSVDDEIRLLDVGVDPLVEKAVDVAQAAPGDLLTYSVRVRLEGAGQRDSVFFEDKLPAFTAYESGTLQLDGQNLTDGDDADVGSYDPGTGVVRVDLSALPSDTDATVLLQVRVDNGVPIGTRVENRARVVVHTPAGALTKESAPAVSDVAAPALRFTKVVSGLDPVQPGDSLTYTIEVENPSAALAATSLTIVDTIPEPLDVVDVTPSATVNGRELRWTVARLAPGATATFDVVVEVPPLADTVTVVNRAYLVRDGASDESAESAARTVMPGVDASLALDLQAEVVEIQLGDALPLVSIVTNDGPATLTEVLVKLALPAGTRFLDEGRLDGAFVGARASPALVVDGGETIVAGASLSGGSGQGVPAGFVETPIVIDSFEVIGDTLYVTVPGELRPNEALRFRYLLLVNSAPSGVVLNRAIAEARRGSLQAVSAIVVASNQAQALVGLARNRALETRLVIGKVFHDRNGDGFQDAEEPGVPGVDVITADGELVTSDAFGKFSFTNLRPGRHALRVDPLSIPDGLTLRREGLGQRLQVVEITGWNSPRVTFALDGEWAPSGIPVPAADAGGAGVEPGLRAPAAPSPGAGARTAAGGDGDGERMTPPRGFADGGSGRPVRATATTATGATTDDGGPAAAEVARDRGAALDAPPPNPTIERDPDQTTVRVAPLRTDEERAADERAAFLHGPGVRVNDPVDGYVSATNRVYIGVKAEPMGPVALFRGDSLVSEGQLLPNGVGDFIGVELEPGPQIFRIRTRNSWGNERWDSLVVHQSGVPVRLAPEDERVTLVDDGRAVTSTRVRLYDAWDVPVVSRPYVTVRVEGGRVVGRDVDPSSEGQQLRADADGWVTVELVGDRTPGEGVLLVETPDAELLVPIEVLPAIRPLFLTGVGQLSLGSGGDAFGALTARGRLTDGTALTLSYDSRKLDQGRDVFGRNFDPLEEGQQPILGDASTQRSLSSSRYRLSARLERGLDWVAFGDVQTSGFSDGMELARYGRSLPGAAARVTTGDVVWNAFGAATTQALRQQQIRGEGSSGPYELGGGVLPGTEEVRVQVRALENPTRILSEKLLTRYAEYQIDYVRGVLLLKQPVPAADPFGNPVFLLVSYEGESGGDRSGVWGVRANGALDRFAGSLADSVPVSVSFVNDGLPGRAFRLGAFRAGAVGAGGAEVGVEVAVASGADSSGVATRLEAKAPLLDGRARLAAQWTHVGDEFTNPGNIALRPGTDEVRANGSLDVGEGRVLATHERQRFTTRDLSRRRSTVGYTQEVVEDVTVEGRIAADGSSTTTGDASSAAGEYKATWAATDALDLFAEGRSELWARGEGLANRGAYYGVGGSYRLSKRFAVESRWLRVNPTGDANPYNLTSIGLTSDLRVGTKAWGAYQISGGIDGQRNAAVVGLNHRFSIGADWRVSTLLERRDGVAGATLGDPVLVSPFEQPEDDYTSTSFGVEYLPQTKPYRASLRAENRDGTLSSSRLATLAGDVSFNAGLALLSRSELVERDVLGSLNDRYTRERSTLWGLAYRPTARDDLNVLFKFAWKDAINPFGSGVLATDGEESRLIGAMEAIWAPRGDVEFGMRFATRTTRLATPLTEVTDIITRNESDFVGVRGRWFAHRYVGVELEARGLMTGLAPGAVWDVAPSLVTRPVEALEVELGWRFGDLQDPDFAVRSGDGVFLTIGTRVTEDLLDSAASFWRSRFGG